MATVLKPTRPKPLLDASSAGLRMTLAQFRAIKPEDVDERFKYELVSGVLVVSPPPSPFERGPNDHLGYLLRNYQNSHPNGHHLNETLYEEELATLPDTMRRADRAIWAGLGGPPDFETDVPSILIEFLSPGKRSWERDYEIKRDEYLGVGVKEYWVFDRFERQLTVFRKNKRAKIIKEHQTYESALLPGFVLKLDVLLEQVDKINKKRRK